MIPRRPLLGQVVEFVGRRLEQMLVDGGASVEAVRAALAERSADPCLAARTAQDLQVPPQLPCFPVSPSCPYALMCVRTYQRRAHDHPEDSLLGCGVPVRRLALMLHIHSAGWPEM